MSCPSCALSCASPHSSPSLSVDDLFRRKIEEVDINQPPTAERPGYFTDYDGVCASCDGL